MNGFREVGLAEMRQIEGGGRFFDWVKKAARWTWEQVKKRL